MVIRRERISFALSLAFFCSVLLLSLAASARAAVYMPGETLDPDCFPTDPTCYVQVPVTVSTSTNSASAPSFTATGPNASVFPYASTTEISVSGGSGNESGLTLGTLTGILKAVGGLVQTALISLSSDVTGVLSIANGGTGSSTAPTEGQILLGNSSGGYDLVATSSLGIAATPGGSSGEIQFNSAGVLQGAAGLTYDAVTHALALLGGIDVAGTATLATTTATSLTVSATTTTEGLVANVASIVTGIINTLTATLANIDTLTSRIATVGSLTATSSLTVNGTTSLATTSATNLSLSDSNPAATGNLLYSQGGTLYWNGNALGIAGSGLQLLNGLASSTQLFAVGVGGSDFSITSAGNTHTFNLPDAGSTARGVVSTTSQTFAGAKSFTATTTLNMLDMNSTRIIGLAAPLGANDATNKAYVDSFVSGIAWQNPVINLATTSAPGGPVTGDRYVLQAGASGFGSCTTNQIAQWSGSAWTCATPSSGWTVYLSQIATNYNYNGTSWVSLGSTVNHRQLTGLQGGNGSDEYYHLDLADYNALHTGNPQLRSLQTTGAPSFAGLTITSSSTRPDSLNVTGTTTITGNTTVSATTTTQGLVANVASIVTGIINSLTATLANIDTLTSRIATVGSLTATSSLNVTGTTTLATTSATNLTAGTGLFGTLVATTSAVLSSTTVQGTLVAGNIVATSTATSTFGGSLAIGTTTGSAALTVLATSGQDLLRIGTSTNQNVMTITSSGNMGLGTGTPAAKLDIANLGSGLSLNVQGAVAFKKGSDFATTTAYANNVDFGNTSLVRVNSPSDTFLGITGIAGGYDGEILTIMNASSTSSFMLFNQSVLSTASNRIITGVGGDLQIEADASALLIYDSATARWRVIGGSGGGSAQTTLNTVTASSTLASFNVTNRLDATAGNLVITLPNAIGNAGKSMEFVKTDNTSNSVMIKGVSNQQIASTTYLWLYAQNDAVTLRSDGANWQIVSDNRSSVGVSNSYFSASLAGAQSIANNLVLNYSGGTASQGTDIIPVGSGTYKLKAGKTYRLTATLRNQNIATVFDADYGWYNVTAGAYMSGTTGDASDNNNIAPGSTQAVVVFTPSVDTNVNVRATNVSGTATSDPVYSNMYIEVISAQQPVINTVDYLIASKGPAQTSVSSSTDITMSTSPAEMKGNMEFDGTYVTLKAGKTYKLSANLGINQWSASTSAQFLTFDFVDSSNASVGFGSIGNPVSPRYEEGATSTQISSRGTDSSVEKIFTPLVDTKVKLRMTGMGGTNATVTIISASQIKIEQIGSTAATGLSFSNLTGAIATGALDNTNFAQQWNWSTATTSASGLLSLSANALTSGALMTLNTATASTSALALSINGAIARVFGTDFATSTPYANDVNFGNTSRVRVNTTSPAFQGITGIAGGVDGKELTIVNASSTAAFIIYDHTATTTSSAVNRIITGTGSNLIVAPDAVISLVYDSTAMGSGRWRVMGGGGSGSGNQTKVLSATASTTLASTVYGSTQKIDATSGNLVITLPTAIGFNGASIEFVKTDNSANSAMLKGAAGQQIASTTYLWLYTQNDAVTLRSDGANWQIVSDNRSSVGASASYLQATLAAAQLTATSSGDHVLFKTVLSQQGNDITLATTSTYATSVGADSVGRFTLKAGKTYRLTGTINYVRFELNATTSLVDFRWRNADTGAEIGTGGAVRNLNITGDTNSIMSAEAIITPVVDTRVELTLGPTADKVKEIGIASGGVNFFPTAYVEVIAAPQPVLNTVDYIKVNKTVSQAVVVNDTVLFESTESGNIPYDPATGRFTLTAGKTYNLQTQLTHHGVSTSTFLDYRWYNESTGSYIGNAGDSISENYNSNSVTAPIASSLFTATTTTVVSVKIIFAGTGATVRNTYSYASIQQIGSTGSTGLSLNYVSGAIGAGILDNQSFAQQWDWSSAKNTATTTGLLKLSANALASGNLLYLDTHSASSSAVALAVNGIAAFFFGSDFATSTPYAANVDFGNTSRVRVNTTSSAFQGITGIAGGTDGRDLTIVNASSTAAFTLYNQSASSTAANRIITGTGGDLSVAGDATVHLTYDATSARWRVVGGSGGGSAQTTVISQTASTTLSTTAFGTTQKLDATNGNLIITLPTAVGNAGKSIEFVKTDNTSNSVMLQGVVSQQIAFTTYLWLYTQNSAVTLRSDGSNWQIVSDNRSSVGASKSYLHATFTASQSTNLASGDHFKYNTVRASNGNDIALDTATAYTSSSNVASLGRFTLKAGKTYRLSAHTGEVIVGTQNAVVFNWFNADTNTAIGVQNLVLPVTSTFNGGDDPSNETVFTPTVDTRVEFRIVNGGGFSSGNIGSGSAYPTAYIEVISAEQPVISTVDYVFANQATAQNPAVGGVINYTGNVQGTIVSLGSGRYRLEAGKTYKLQANWAPADVSAQLGEYQFYNVTAGAFFGQMGSGADPENSNSLGINAEAVLTPTVATDVEVRWTSDGASGSDTQKGSLYIVQIGSTAMTGLSFNYLTGALAAGSLDNTSFAQQWNWSTATSTTAMALNANALTTGSLLTLTSSSTALNSTNGLFYVANVGTSTSGMLASFVASTASKLGMYILNNGNVGIGTSTPASAFDVSIPGAGVIAQFSGLGTTGTSFPFVRILNTATTSRKAVLELGQSASSTLRWQIGTDVSGAGSQNFFIWDNNAGAERMRIDGSGRMGIGTTSPTNTLSVQQSATGVVASFTNGTGNCAINPTTTALVCSSDATLKHDIAPIGDGILSDMLTLSPSTYVWNEDDSGALQYGFIAQDVQKVFPTLVSTSTTNGKLMLSQTGMIPFIVKALQEQSGLTFGTSTIALATASTTFPEGIAPALASLASTTAATSTETEDGNTHRTFLGQVFDRIGLWLADAQNGIETIRARAFTSEQVNTEKLCVGDVCVTQDEFMRLLNQSNVPYTGSAPSVTVVTGDTNSGSGDGDMPPEDDTEGGEPVITDPASEEQPQADPPEEEAPPVAEPAPEPAPEAAAPTE